MSFWRSTRARRRPPPFRLPVLWRPPPAALASVSLLPAHYGRVRTVLVSTRHHTHIPQGSHTPSPALAGLSVLPAQTPGPPRLIRYTTGS